MADGNIVRNVELMQWRAFFLEGKFVNPFFTAFLLSRGVTESEAFLLGTVYALTVIVLEIPTGYLGDLIGRSRTLIFGALCLALGNWFAALSYGFWMMAAAQSMKAAGDAFDSGTSGALIVDTAKAMKGDVLHGHGLAESGRHFIKFLVPIAAWIFGYWFTGSDLYSALAWCGAIFISLGLLPTMRLVEPQRTKSERFHLHEGLKPLLTHSTLRLFMVHEGIVTISGLILYFAYIPRLRACGISDGALTLIYAAFHLTGFLHARFLATKLDRTLGAPLTVNILTAVTVAPAIIMALTDEPWVVVTMFVILWPASSVRALYYLKYSQRFIPDEVRATTGSIMSFLQRLVEVPCLFLASLLADQGNEKVFLMIAALNTILFFLRFPSLQKIHQSAPSAS